MDPPPRPYRLLVVASALDRAEQALYTGLQEAGIHLDLLLPPGCDRWDDAKAIFPGLKPFPVRHRLDFCAVRRLRHHLREHRPDLIYAPLNRPLSVCLLATATHPMPIIGYRGTLGHLSRWDPATRLTYRHPRLTHILCVSDAVRDYLRDRIHIPSDRLTRIYKGHDPAWYEPSPEMPRRHRKEFNLPEQAFVVGFFGNIRPVKGVDVLVRALDFLPNTVHLLLVGHLRDPRVRREAQRRDSKRIHFTGFRADAPAIMGLCDVVALPSRAREGLPRAAIEAMCRRRAVVAGHVGGLPELLDHGRGGLLVPPGDAGALADALRRLLDDTALRSRLAEAGRQRIEARFHIRQTLRQTLALHRRILDATSSAQR